MKYLKYKYLIISCLAIALSTFSQLGAEDKTVQYSNESIQIYHEIKVNATPEKAWDKIALEFANIGDVHPDMEYSYTVDKTLRYGLHALRHCQLNDEKYIRENIIRWDENNKMYTYRLYDSEGMSFMMKQCDFGIKIKNGETYLFHFLQYKMKNKRQTRRHKTKMEKANLKLLRVYREEIENEI